MFGPIHPLKVLLALNWVGPPFAPGTTTPDQSEGCELGLVDVRLHVQDDALLEDMASVNEFGAEGIVALPAPLIVTELIDGGGGAAHEFDMIDHDPLLQLYWQLPDQNAGQLPNDEFPDDVDGSVQFDTGPEHGAPLTLICIVSL